MSHNVITCLEKAWRQSTTAFQNSHAADKYRFTEKLKKKNLGNHQYPQIIQFYFGILNRRKQLKMW